MCWYYTKYFIACVPMEKSDNITHIEKHKIKNSGKGLGYSSLI